jgi:uncharacterized protein YuzE
MRNDDLIAPYKPAAVVYRDSDMMEYVNCDHLTISERIDENLSIVRDRDGKIVGAAISNWSKIRR